MGCSPSRATSPATTCAGPSRAAWAISGESFGQIYPALKRLSAQGVIVANRRARGGRAGRQEYSLTPAGRARLRDWLAQPYRLNPPRDEFLLKLFFGREAAPAVSIAHVREFQTMNRRLLATIEEIGRIGAAKNAQHPHFRFWMLTLDYGVAQIRAALQWSEQAIKVLQSMEKPAGERAPKQRANAKKTGR